MKVRLRVAASCFVAFCKGFVLHSYMMLSKGKVKRRGATCGLVEVKLSSAELAE